MHQTPKIVVVFFLFFHVRSSTGKSTLLKSLVKDHLDSKTNLVLINVKPDEVGQYRKVHSKLETGAGILSLKKVVKGSLVIIEDVIKFDAKEEVCMRTFLNYHAHHRRLKIFCVSHTVHKTGLYSMIPLFNYLIYTSSSSNIPIIRFTLQYFRIEKPVIARWMVKFNEGNNGGGKIDDYYFFDATQMVLYKTSIKFETASIVGTLNTDLNSSNCKDGQNLAVKELIKKCESFFDGNVLKAQASAVFSIIIRVLPLVSIREFDLTMTFVTTATDVDKKKEKRISLVDYICCLLDNTASAPVSSDFVVLHKYISERCILPSIFVRNSLFTPLSLSRWPTHCERKTKRSRQPDSGKLDFTKKQKPNSGIDWILLICPPHCFQFALEK